MKELLLNYPSLTCRWLQFGPDAVGYLRVEIIDSGVGLSEDEQRNVFEEFTQFNKNELQSGGNSVLCTD